MPVAAASAIEERSLAGTVPPTSSAPGALSNVCRSVTLRRPIAGTMATRSMPLQLFVVNVLSVEGTGLRGNRALGLLEHLAVRWHVLFEPRQRARQHIAAMRG